MIRTERKVHDGPLKVFAWRIRAALCNKGIRQCKDCWRNEHCDMKGCPVVMCDNDSHYIGHDDRPGPESKIWRKR